MAIVYAVQLPLKKRARLQWFFSSIFEVFAGAGYDANVVPDQTIDTLFDMHKMTVSAGLRLELFKRRVMAIASWTQVVYFERTAPTRPRDDAGNPITPLPPLVQPRRRGHLQLVHRPAQRAARVPLPGALEQP